MNMNISFRNSFKSPFFSVTNGKKQHKEKVTNSSVDFTSMGTIKSALIQQKSKERLEGLISNTKNDSDEPTYERRVTKYGVDITDDPHAHKVRVPISDDVKEKIRLNVKESFENTGRDKKASIKVVDDFYKIKEDYLKRYEDPKDKLSPSWSLSEYGSDVHSAVESRVRELDPSWDWGKPVKNEVLSEIFGDNFNFSI